MDIFGFLPFDIHGFGVGLEPMPSPDDQWFRQYLNSEFDSRQRLWSIFGG